MTLWNSVSLGDLISLQRGYDLPEHQRSPGAVPVFGSAGINGYHDRARADGPGVTVGRSGASFGVVHYSSTAFWPHNTVLFVTDFKGNDERFIYYLLKNCDFASYNSGSAQPSLNRNYLYSIRLRIPEVDTQRRIVSVLSAYDDLIENNSRRIAILEEMAQAIYREWFVNFRFPGYEQVSMVESKLGPVPAGWGVVPLSALAQVRRRNLNPSTHPHEVFAHYSIPAFDNGRRPTLEPGSAISSTKHVVERGMVLLSKLNPRIPRVWLPNPPADHRSICSTEFVVLAPASVTQPFLYALLRSGEFAGRLAARAGGTSTSHQRVKPGDLMSMPVVLPAREHVDGFSATAQPMFALAENLRSRNEVLRRTGDLLLPKLISGEIEVEAVDEAFAGALV